MLPKLLVILPAYNESLNITRTIEGVRASVDADILVINDGSQDDTARVAERAGAFVLNMPYNVGIGAGVQAGFQFAVRYGYEVVIRNDGDGQHAAQDIQRLLEPVLAQRVDVAIGSRFLADGDYGTPITRRLGIGILATLLTRITRQPVTDPTSGFATFNARAIALFARLYPHDYPEPEAIVLMHKAGVRFCEVPVQMHKRQAGQSSITPLRSAYYMVKVILAILINVLRQAPIMPL